EEFPRETARLEYAQATIRVRRTDARQQLQYAKCSDAIFRVVRPLQYGEHVFDVRSFQKFKAAVFHVRNVSSHEFDFKDVAVMRVAHQYRLVAQQHAALARR